jgi:N,N-dimethylformamidase
MGHIGARSYERVRPLDPRAAFIFEGVAEEEPIGASGLCLGGAASLEVDRLDRGLGTPPEAILLASATGFPEAYAPAGEDVTTAADVDPAALVRADMVYVEYPSGGAVFSVGSIGWCGGLSADGYGGAVARITGNVLDRFAERS